MAPPLKHNCSIAKGILVWITEVKILPFIRIISFNRILSPLFSPNRQYSATPPPITLARFKESDVPIISSRKIFIKIKLANRWMRLIIIDNFKHIFVWPIPRNTATHPIYSERKMQEIAHPIKYSVALFLTQISASANIASIRDPAKKESTMEKKMADATVNITICPAAFFTIFIFPFPLYWAIITVPAADIELNIAYVIA